jgi:hypothetical protein
MMVWIRARSGIKISLYKSQNIMQFVCTSIFD